MMLPPSDARTVRVVTLLAWGIVLLSALEFASMIPALFIRSKPDFAAFYHVATLVKSGHGEKVYEFGQVMPKEAGYTPVEYLYPPVLAVAMVPVTFVRYQLAFRFWVALSLVLIAHSLYLVYRVGVERGLPAKGLVPFLLILGLRSPALIEDLLLGNCNSLILWLTVVTVFAACRGRDILAGGVLAIAVLIKLTPATLLLYFIIARRWRGLAAFVIVCAVGLGVTAVITGPACMHGFVEAVNRIPHLPPSTSNHSLWGVLQRFLINGTETLAPAACPELARPLWYLLGAAVFVATLAMVLRRKEDALYCLGIQVCMSALLSPVTRSSHLGVLLVPVLWMLTQLRWTWPPRPAELAIGTLLVLLLLVPDPIYQWPVHAVPILILASKQFVGVLSIWALLLFIGKGKPPAVPCGSTAGGQ